VKKTSKKWKKRPPPSTENELNVSEMQNFQFFSRFGGVPGKRVFGTPKEGSRTRFWVLKGNLKESQRRPGSFQDPTYRPAVFTAVWMVNKVRGPPAEQEDSDLCGSCKAGAEDPR